MRQLTAWMSLTIGCTLVGCGHTATNATPPPSPANSQASVTASIAPSDDKQAITQAIEAHLRENKGINMSAMDMTVSNISIDGDQAQADAEFRLKQGGTSMMITYFLQRHADGWLVLRNQPSGASQFAHPPMDKVHSGAAASPMPDLTNFLHSKTPAQPSHRDAKPQ